MLGLVRDGTRPTSRMRDIVAVVAIFFTAVLTVVVQIFNAKTVILAELVRLKESPMLVRTNPAMDYVCYVVWGIMYADETCTVSRSPRGLAKIIEVIVEVCRAFALTVSENKAETMCMHPPRTLRTTMWFKAAG